jgi:CRP/FNR family cyclic AMP-dependent transcriptional regulator
MMTEHGAGRCQGKLALGRVCSLPWVLVSGEPAFAAPARGRNSQMVVLDDLKSIIMLSYLTDPMLKKIAEVTTIMEFGTGSYIFREGEYARYLYSVIAGKVGLELEKTASNVVLLDTIGRGRTFGFSALIDMEPKKYITHAKALADTRLFTWDGADLERLFYEDFEMGFLLMKRIAKIAKTRLQARNVQFLDIYG